MLVNRLPFVLLELYLLLLEYWQPEARPSELLRVFQLLDTHVACDKADRVVLRAVNLVVHVDELGVLQISRLWLYAYLTIS